jgi:NAD+ synthase
MNKNFIFSLAQLNFTVGDIEGNYEKICKAYDTALQQGSSLLITPELGLIGYPPEDIVFKQSLINKANHYRSLLTNLTRNKSCAIILGSVFENKKKLYNAAFFLAEGKNIRTITKYHLPNYGVFDEKRLFSQGELAFPINYNGVKLGLVICEDGWFPEALENLCNKSAHVIISINASPFNKIKFTERMEVAQAICKKYNRTYVYLNQVGGQDAIILDGGSFVLNPNGNIVSQAKFFTEDITHVHMKHDKKLLPTHEAIATKTPSTEALAYQAMMLGVRDYISKNNFSKVILGLSGGIDSAVVATIAVDALGSKNVHAVMLPTEFTSQKSIEDAELLAKKLDLSYEVISVQNIFELTKKSLNRKSLKDTTVENIQARIRGFILMGLSNETGALLLNTGNKSELAIGYTTLYGDLCGVFAPIKDLYKTELYAVAKWRNSNLPEFALGKKGKIIHDSILLKQPSAELRHNQIDQNTLPPYELLDPILYHLIEENLSKQDIIQKGFNKTIVEGIIKMLYSSEFKRRQSPPGTKISTMHFNIDRRYPITNKFTE